MKRSISLVALLFTPYAAHASKGAERLDLTGNWVGITSVLLFFVAYLLRIEEYLGASAVYAGRKAFVR